jgi:hypothetical protein
LFKATIDQVYDFDFDEGSFKSLSTQAESFYE